MDFLEEGFNESGDAFQVMDEQSEASRGVSPQNVLGDSEVGDAFVVQIMNEIGECRMMDDFGEMKGVTFENAVLEIVEIDDGVFLEEGDEMDMQMKKIANRMKMDGVHHSGVAVF